MRRGIKKVKYPVFIPKKEYSKKRHLIFLIEAGVITIILVGTIAIFLIPKDLSFKNVAEKFRNSVGLKKTETPKDDQTYEDLLRASLDGKVLKVSSIKKSDDSFYTVESTEGLKIVFDENKDLSSQIRALQTLLSKAKINKKRPVFIDFRFEKLVVRYSE